MADGSGKKDPDGAGLPQSPPATPTLREWLSSGDAFDLAMNPNFLGAFAHTGCVGALQREGLLSSLVGLSGSSAGAMCGAILASGRQVLENARGPPYLHGDMALLTSLGTRRWEVLDAAPGLGILRGDGLERVMAELMAPTFETLAVPFACATWSAFSLRTEILHSGPLARAVRASSTVPGLLQPTSHAPQRWLVDGGIGDPSGALGLSALPHQPQRSLHIVVNRRMPVLLGLDSRWSNVVGPSKFPVRRGIVASVRLNNPPNLLLGDRSFQLLGPAVLATAEAMLASLDRPMRRCEEEGHFILDVDVASAWGRRSQQRSRL